MHLLESLLLVNGRSTRGTGRGVLGLLASPTNQRCTARELSVGPDGAGQCAIPERARGELATGSWVLWLVMNELHVWKPCLAGKGRLIQNTACRVPLCCAFVLKNLIGFIKRFMNRAAFYRSSRRGLLTL